jgi:hypothetical protein
MAIVQISKIQQRSGNLVDLPQLDEAEFGFASDEKRLFIGKTEQGLENIEVLTSYSEVDFNQINGSYGNLDIDITSNTAAGANGQVLAFDGNNWVNRGGNAGGLLTLGDVSNVKITGGSIGYVLETDGTGNLSWTPKSTIIAFIQNISKANPAVITTTEDNFLIEGAEITITDAVGMTEINGNSYYIDILTSNTFALYTDSSLSTALNTTGGGYTAYAYTSVTATTASTNYVTVGSTSSFTANNAIKFLGTTFGGITANTTYYVKNIVNGTTMTISLTEGGSELTLTTASGSCNVYATGGRVICAVGGSGVANAAGSNSTVQFNNSNLLDADADFTWNNNTGINPKILTVNGNANVGNLNASGVVTTTRVFSNITSGSGSPFVVSSTDRVANLNVSYSNVTDFSVVTAQTTGTFYPVLVSSTSTSNQALGVNNAISFNALTSNLALTGNLSVTANANVGNIGATQGIFSSNISAANANLGNLMTANFVTGTLTVASNAQPNLTSFGNGTQVTVAGNLNPNANVTYNLGNTTNRWNALYLSGSTIYLGNATITSNASGVVITNASGGSFTIGGTSAANGAAIVNGNSSVVVTANSNVNISSNGVANVLVITNTGANVTGTANITGNANVGNLGATSGVFTGTLNVTGNANVGNIGGTNGVLTGTLNVTGNANVGNLGTGGLIVATGNVTGGNLVTSGALSVTGNANVGNIGAAAGVFTTIAGSLTTSSQPNITSVGTLTSLAVTGNISGANITGTHYGAATGLTSIPGANVTGTVANATYATSAGSATSATTAGTVTTAAQPNITSVGTLTSLTVSGATSVTGNSAFTVTNITSGANTTLGYITGNWTLTSGSRMQATYADLAEYYSADEQYSPGTVLEFGGKEEVTLATDATNRVAGVVSTDPAYAMNAKCPGEFPVAIALQGRVPCKVRGKIKKGDMLISGGGGYARPTTSPQIGTVIGKALQDFEGVQGVIEVAVGRL